MVAVTVTEMTLGVVVLPLVAVAALLGMITEAAVVTAEGDPLMTMVVGATAVVVVEVATVVITVETLRSTDCNKAEDGRLQSRAQHTHTL